MTAAEAGIDTGAIVAQANTSAGYARASGLAQTGDEGPALSFLPPDTARVIDLGCGTGSLLRRILEDRPATRELYGIDTSPDRLREARQLLGPSTAAVTITLRQADLRRAPAIPGEFDAAVMTHVLHWLYPAEAQVFRWLRDRLRPGGTFILASPHPETGPDGLGGTDELVREALHELGVPLSEVRARFDDAGVVPLGTRCRSRSAIEELLRPHFTVDAVQERPAMLRVSSGAEYVTFHAATYGTTYSQIAGPDRAEEFFAALALVAGRRAGPSGVVGGHPIRMWKCTRRPGATTPCGSGRPVPDA